ncbi:uncharacterized protein Dere_GG10240 [Drosophila erecta]|uniref:Uncharacterized protein n=1 Tax=Drosophila erecta TaxID=7220 RepID=B3N3C6_DROER|nr:uncharacterized protein Dere_GG10240 [Drosophila erecta]
MDYRQMKNDAYGIGQRRGMGSSSVGGGGGGSGGGMYSSNFGGGLGSGANFGGGGNTSSGGYGGNSGGGGYGGNKNSSPDGGNFNRGGGYNNINSGGNNSYPRSGVGDRTGFNPSNQRFGDNYQDNFRGGPSSNFGQANRGSSNSGNVARLLELENRIPGNSGNFNMDRNTDSNYRGPQSQGSGDRFCNDEPRNQGSFGNFGPNDGLAFGGNNSSSFSGNNGPAFGGNNGPAYGGNNGPSFGGSDVPFAGNTGPSFGGNNQRNFNNDNFPNRGHNFDDQRSDLNDSYGRGGNQGNFVQNSGNFGDNNRDIGNFNNRRPAGGGSGGLGFNQNSGGNFGNNNAGGGFSNNISRTFQDSRNNWNKSQSSSFQSSGYQSNSRGGGGSGGGGGGVGAGGSGWEASQRAFNSKRNQLQKMNLNNGGSVRKPGPQPAARAVQNLRNNPQKAAAIVKTAVAPNLPNNNNRNNQPNKPANLRPGNPAGVQKKLPIAAPNQYKVNNLAPKASTAVVANKKPAVTGQVVRSGPQAARTGPPGLKTGPQLQKSGPVAPRPGQQAVKGGPHLGKPAGVPNRPPNGPGFPVQVGQKRVAPAPPLETEAASKSVKKWRRVARKRGFLIGGFKIPYLNDQPKKLPQPEADSYALTFFEQTFNYSTNQDATEEDFLEAAVVLNEDSEDESVADDAKSARKNAKRNRKRIRSEWGPLSESKKYKDWGNWWKDYKNVGEEIDQQLVECGNLNLEHCFLPNLPKLSTEQVVYAIIKSAHFGLEKNADVPYDTMKTIFTLMNRTLLENLTELNMVEIQDIIRGIPNDLWVYKLRSMVFLWAKYKTIINSKSTAEDDVKDQQAIAREWKSPCFHWLAKQAFDELVAISETEWNDHRTVFPPIE